MQKSKIHADTCNVFGIKVRMQKSKIHAENVFGIKVRILHIEYQAYY
jgi:hypothetical protein